jgi:hypothetical protein
MTDRTTMTDREILVARADIFEQELAATKEAATDAFWFYQDQKDKDAKTAAYVAYLQALLRVKDAELKFAFARFAVSTH